MLCYERTIRTQQWAYQGSESFDNCSQALLIQVLYLSAKVKRIQPYATDVRRQVSRKIWCILTPVKQMDNTTLFINYNCHDGIQHYFYCE